MPLIAASISRQGGRPYNEDRYDQRLAADGGLWALADGLGGHIGGQQAAQLAVDAALANCPADAAATPTMLAGLLFAAQQAILAGQEADPYLCDMRTTLILLRIADGQAAWAHCGDSRLYQFRAGAVLHHTEDHSLAFALYRSGNLSYDDIRQHRDRNKLLRCLGQEDDLRASHAGPYPVQAGDAFLLCTDGFWEPVLEQDMLGTLASATDPADWLARMEQRLLARIDARHDNYSATAIWLT